MDRQQPTKTENQPPGQDAPGEGGTGSGTPVELSLSAAIARGGGQVLHRRALTSQLMEQAVRPDNLNQAYARVVANKGSPGTDGMRVMGSVFKFLEDKLHLRVNRLKSAVAHVSERKFLGYRLLSSGRLGIAPQPLKRYATAKLLISCGVPARRAGWRPSAAKAGGGGATARRCRKDTQWPGSRPKA